jgi:hypothetical protein
MGMSISHLVEIDVMTSDPPAAVNGCIPRISLSPAPQAVVNVPLSR